MGNIVYSACKLGMGISLLKLFTIINHTQQMGMITPTPTKGAADNIFDRNYATGLLTKQQHGGSLKSVE